MILEAELINRPYSGQFREKIYDISSPWNSQDWTCVKFINEDFTEWCGDFRGLPIDVALSKIHNCVLVLTSDYLFQVNLLNGELIDYEDHHQYVSLTVTPSEDFLVANYNCIEIIKSSINDKKLIEVPIELGFIHFHGWFNNKLTISAEELPNYNQVNLILDGATLQITIIDSTKH